jgi:predicted nucleic acid-binding protein
LKIVIDSYAWIEQFAGSANAKKVSEILANADELYTPDIVLAEIARKYIRDGIDDDTIHNRLRQISDNSKIVNLEPKLAFESAKCYSEIEKSARKNKFNTPSLADAIVLATARMLKSKVLTGDQHFKSLPETIWI